MSYDQKFFNAVALSAHTAKFFSLIHLFREPAHRVGDRFWDWIGDASVRCFHNSVKGCFQGIASIGLLCGLLVSNDAIAQARVKPVPVPVYPVPISAVSSAPIYGAWASLDAKAANNLNNIVSKQYLYVYQDRWYLSPITKLSWKWDSGQELRGTYQYANGTVTGSVDCLGSGEQPPFGVGCSEGPGSTRKVLPWNGWITSGLKGTKNPNTGQGTVCQNIPSAYGPNPCYEATIYVREVYELLTNIVAATLQPTTVKRYLYLYQDRWFRSPATNLSWSWDFGQQMVGIYEAFNGTASSTVQCNGSVEQPTFGVGCSEGAGNTHKVIPWDGWITSTLKGTKSPSTGQGTICQDSPGIFGPEPCYIGSIYVQER